MSKLRARTIRLNLQQERDLKSLSQKLNLDPTNVIRLALTRLVEQELPQRLPTARS